MNKENKKSYLPSNEFITRITILLVILVIATFAISIFDYFKEKRGNKKTGLSSSLIKTDNGLTVSDVIIKDTNINGIPDWEESLWGLNPLKNGQSNKEFIEGKKKALNSQENKDNISGEVPENETDQLSREFFSSFMALRQSDTLNTNAIENLATTISQKVGDTDLPDTYLVNQIKTTSSNKANLIKYQSDLEKIFIKYENIELGDELSIMADAVEAMDYVKLQELYAVSNTYRSLAKDILNVSTPTDIQSEHFQLVNSYDKLGISIEKMSEAIDNPVTATTGVIMYARYTKEINIIVEEIKTTFIDSGIL